MLVDTDEIARRRAALEAAGGYAYPASQTPWQAMQRAAVGQMHTGAILEGASFVGAIFECFETRLETESVLGRSVAEIRVNRILGNANGLRTCCFARAIFRGNDLSNVNLAGADLSGADFSDADLSGECTPLTQNVNIFNGFLADPA